MANFLRNFPATVHVNTVDSVCRLPRNLRCLNECFCLERSPKRCDGVGVSYRHLRGRRLQQSRQFRCQMLAWHPQTLLAVDSHRRQTIQLLSVISPDSPALETILRKRGAETEQLSATLWNYRLGSIRSNSRRKLVHVDERASAHLWNLLRFTAEPTWWVQTHAARASCSIWQWTPGRG